MSNKLVKWTLNCRLPRGSKQKCIICQLIICLVLVPSNHARYWPWYRVSLSSVLFLCGCARQFAGRDDSNPYLCTSRRNVAVRRRKRGRLSEKSNIPQWQSRIRFRPWIEVGSISVSRGFFGRPGGVTIRPSWQLCFGVIGWFPIIYTICAMPRGGFEMGSWQIGESVSAHYYIDIEHFGCGNWKLAVVKRVGNKICFFHFFLYLHIGLGSFDEVLYF